MSVLSNILSTMSERDRRALILLFEAVALILAVRFVVYPLLDATEDFSGAIPVREKILRKHRALAAAAPLRENNYGGAKNLLAEAEKGLLSSETGPLAVAEVQQQVRDLATATGIQIRSIGFMPLKKSGPDYALAPVSLQFTSRVDQLEIGRASCRERV